MLTPDRARVRAAHQTGNLVRVADYSRNLAKILSEVDPRESWIFVNWSRSVALRLETAADRNQQYRRLLRFGEVFGSGPARRLAAAFRPVRPSGGDARNLGRHRSPLCRVDRPRTAPRSRSLPADGVRAAGSPAFEIARQLKECGKEVDNLFLIDSWVPRYFARQPPLRRLIGDYSLRWQLILADWRKVVVAGEQSFSAFLSNRMVVKNRRHLFGRIGLLRMPHIDAPKREDTLGNL